MPTVSAASSGVPRRGYTVEQSNTTDLSVNVNWFMTADAGTVQVAFKPLEAGGQPTLAVYSCVPGVMYWGRFQRLYASTNTTATVIAMGD